MDTRCHRTPNSEWRREGGVPLLDRSYPTLARRYDGLCLVSKSEPVPAEGISIQVRRLIGAFPLIRLQSGKALIVSRAPASGPQVLGELRQGRIEYLALYPWFLAGCALMSAGPSWECVWQAWGGALTVGQRDDYGRYHADMDQAIFVAQRLGVAHH